MPLSEQSSHVFVVELRKTKDCLPMSMKKITMMKDAATEAKINNHSIT